MAHSRNPLPAAAPSTRCPLPAARCARAPQVWKRAVLTAPRGRLTLGTALRSTRPGDRLRIAAGVHSAPLLVPHALRIDAEPLATLTGPITLSGGGDATGNSSGGRVGSLRGVRVEHFYETAVTVMSGRWVLEQCHVVSSRAPSRACASVVLRGVCMAELEGCVVTGCSSAVLVSSSAAKLLARRCSFGNARAAISSERGGHIDVEGCGFDMTQSSGDVGFRLHTSTVGRVAECEVAEVRGMQLWGRIHPPVGVQLGPGGAGLRVPVEVADEVAVEVAVGAGPQG